MPSKTITVTNGDGSTRTITIPDRSRFAGVRTIARNDGTTLTVNRTAPVITSDRKGASRPLLSKLVGGAAAAYSLRDLNDKAGNNKVVQVRRFTDSQERDFLAKEVSNGTLEAFANESVKYFDSTGATDSRGWVITNGLTYSVAVGGTIAPSWSFSTTGGFNNTEKYSFTGYGDNGSHTNNFYFGNAFHVTRIGLSAPNKTVTIEAYVKRTSGSSSDNLYFRPYSRNDANKFTVTGLVQDEWTLVKGTIIKDSVTATRNHIQVGGDTGVTFEISNVKFYSENNDVMVSKWYDQAGNGNDAVQATIGNQPHIAKAGVLTDKGVEFDGTTPNGMHLETPLLVPTIQNTTVVTVSTKRNGSNGYVGQFNRGLDRFYIRPNIVTIGNPATNMLLTGTNDVKTIQTITGTSGGLFTYFKDGTSVGTANYTGDVGGGDSRLGAGNNGSSSLDGIIHEIIVYRTDQSANRPAIEANINNQYDIY